MNIGLIGLPKSGKTTLFNALTGSQAQVSAYATGKAEPNVSIVKVLDDRVRRLSEMYQPKKTVYATVEFVDFVGVTHSVERGDAFSGELMRLVRNADALGLVLRNFDSDLEGPAAAVEDLGRIEDEMLLSDLIIVEKRLERIKAGYQKGQKTDALKVEERILQRIHEHLNASRPIRELTFEPEEEVAVKGFQFLTKKPTIVIFNSSEDRYRKDAALIESLSAHRRVIEIAGTFEMELSRLGAEEAALFMEDMGITESARDRLISLAYETLGYISFFTVGPDEVRAWNIRRGFSAVEAAGTIHTDLARGFIAAECFTYTDLIDAGSEKAVKERGKFRLEGKEYVVSDGDILSIRFNV